MVRIHHRGMNYDIFSKWMVGKYLPNLTENSVITFDNASYHNAQFKPKVGSMGVRNSSEEEQDSSVQQC